MQSALVTLKASLSVILGFSCFFIFMRLQVSSEKIIATYIVLAACSSIVFFANMLSMPNNIFGQPILEQDFSRGIIRVEIVLFEIFPLLVFYGINKYLESRGKKWLLLIAWLAVMIFLSVVRQFIAATAILGLWFYFRKISFAKKLIAIVMVVIVVGVVLPQIPIYKTLIEISEDQRDDKEEDENIRIKAWRYYTYENQPNALTVIFGNGMPSLGNSTWGVQFDSDTDVTGCFAADVGWAGFFYYFGLFATLCLLALLLAALFKKKPFEYQYLNYWIVFVLLTAFTSGIIIYSFRIVTICVVLYLVFGNSSDKRHPVSLNQYNEQDLDEGQFLKHGKYPQLQ